MTMLSHFLVTHLLDRHEWEFSWDARGLRLTHAAHTLVLGVPPVFVDYLEDRQPDL
jgi:hypothetical protein